MKKNNESLSKFDKTVKIAKLQMEKEILKNAEYFGVVFLHINVEDVILNLGATWYYELLLSAGYSVTTARRKMKDFDFDKLSLTLDSWYKTELYPKLYNIYINENKTIKLI